MVLDVDGSEQTSKREKGVNHMNRVLFAVILVLSCSAANAEIICTYDGCRTVPDRYIAPQMAPDGSHNRRPYGNPPTFRYRQMMPDGSYGRSPRDKS
jgi:hypothetical protein